MHHRELIKNTVISLLAFIIMGFFVVIAVSIKSLNPLTETVSNFSFTDIYYSILHQTSTPQESKLISIVDINMFQGRGNFAKLLENIESMHPKAICIDAVFEGPHIDDPEGDMALADVAEKYCNIIFSMKMENLYDQDGMWTSNFPIHSFFTEYLSVKEAFCNMPRGNLYDSMKRSIPISACVDSVTYHSMIVETANMFAGKDVTKGSNDMVKINYSPLEFAKILPGDVLSHPELFDGRIVLLGDLHEANDQHWSPIGEKLAGVEILAYGIQTLLDKKEVIQPPLIVTCILSFLVIFAMCTIYDMHQNHTRDSSNLAVKYLIGSIYVWNIIIFFVSSVLVFISFIIFSKWNISLSWGWTLSTLAFLSTAENLYLSIGKYIQAKTIQPHKP